MNVTCGFSSRRLPRIQPDLERALFTPARTGRLRSRRTAVTRIAQAKSGSLCIDIPGLRMLSTVVMKFIAPSIELIPARCRVKIAQSTAPPVCEPSRLSGG